MTQETDLLLPLLNPSEELLKQEDNLPGGHIPERWLQIENIEIQRVNTSITNNLAERTKAWTEKEVAERVATTKRYFGDLMQEPSFEGGPYASNRWLNFFEMMHRVLDIKADEESIVPDLDKRIPFHSFALNKEMILQKWLKNKIQDALPEGEKLRQQQIDDCFTNVSQVQFNTLVEEIAKSGLTLRPESPNEHWKIISQQSK